MRTSLPPLVFQLLRPRRLVGAAAVALPLAAAVTLVVVGGWTEWHRREARRHLDAYRFAPARHHLDQYLRVCPGDVGARLLAAQTARRDFDFAAAAAHLDEAERRRGELTDDIVLERMMLRAQRGEIDATATFLRARVAAEAPERPLILEAMALGYVQQQRLQEAHFVLQLLLEVQPTNPKAWLLQGWVKEMLNLPDESVESYTRLLELDPDDNQSRLLLANALLEAHLPEKAIGHLELLGRRMPESPAVQVRLATCLAELGRDAEAEAAARQVLALSPDNADAQRVLARLALAAGQLDDAERRVRQVIAAEPWDHRAHFMLYNCLNRAGREDEAKAVQVRMKEIEADSHRLHDLLSQHLGQRPNDPGLNLEGGVILLRSGQPQKALDFLYRALRADPDHSPTHAVLADHYERAGDPQRAAYHRKQVRPGTTVPPLRLSDLPKPKSS